MEYLETPFVAHVFICTNDRQGERKSCADGGGAAIRAALKQGVKEKGWDKYVRVSQSGCLGICAQGPNVMVYPQKISFTNVSLNDVGEILSSLHAIVAPNL